MRLPLQRKVRDRLDAWSHRLPRPLAVALDLIPADPEEAGLIRGAQVRAIVRMTPLVMLASCVNATVVLASDSTSPSAPIHSMAIYSLAIDSMNGAGYRIVGRVDLELADDLEFLGHGELLLPIGPVRGSAAGP